MDIRVLPGEASGEITAPPSKSAGHRALIAAALAKGESRVENLGTSEDIAATIGALRLLGAQILPDKNGARITGIDPRGWNGGEVFCGESGSTLRFLLPVFALSPAKTTFTGAGRLMQRPQQVYRELFAQMGLPFDQTANGITVQGPLKAGEYTLAGNLSSQFFTGLVLALAQVAQDSVLHITQPFESAGYLRLTLGVLEQFGVFARLSGCDLQIPGGQTYRPADFSVEGDYSGAAFFAVLGALCGEVRCVGLAGESAQSDAAILPYLGQIGGRVTSSTGGFVSKKAALSGGTLDLADCPDLGPVLMAAGCFCQNGLLLQNTARLRYKESDRAAVMRAELAKLGFSCSVKENEIFVSGVGAKLPQGEITVDASGDHRVAMALAVAAAAMPVPVVIRGAECTAKSYPAFWRDLARVGIRMEELP